MTRCLNTNWVAKFIPRVSLSPNIGVSKHAMGSPGIRKHANAYTYKPKEPMDQA